MVNRFCIAGHIVELKAPEESVVWDACSKYDPFKTPLWLLSVLLSSLHSLS